MEKEMQTQLVGSKLDQRVPNQGKQPSVDSQISHRA